MSKRKVFVLLLAVPVVVLISIPLIWAFLYFGVYLGYGSYRGRIHQEFALNEVWQIKPAKEMDQLFDDCRHYITYRSGYIPQFNSEAYFGDRYVLHMQVPVEISSPSDGRITGEPQFYLHEVQSISISPDGQISASFSNQLDFGSSEWKTLYDAKGDFSTIGFNTNPTAVPDFAKYAAACRPSN